MVEGISRLKNSGSASPPLDRSIEGAPGSSSIFSDPKVKNKHQCANSNKVHVPKTWGRLDKDSQADLANRFSTTREPHKDANWLMSQFSNTVLETKARDVQDLIMLNPSLFVSTKPGTEGYGVLKQNPDWSKLDIPNGMKLNKPKEAPKAPAQPQPEEPVAKRGTKKIGNANQPAILYKNGNSIHKSAYNTYNTDNTYDSNAIFTIDGKEYELQDTQLFTHSIDYRDLNKVINEDGTFKKNHDMAGNLKFKGTGPLDGCEVKFDSNTRTMGVVYKGTMYPLNDVMSGKVKLK